MNQRKAFTLVELLVVVAIIAIAFIAICSVFKGCSGAGYYSHGTTAHYKCVKFYTYTPQKSEGSAETSKRVDLQEINIETGDEIGIVQTFECNDDFMAGVSNSAQLYAQFVEGEIYNVTSVGERRTGWMSYFPLIKSVRKINQKDLPWEVQ